MKQSSAIIVDDADLYAKLLTKAKEEKEIHMVLGDATVDYQSPK